MQISLASVTAYLEAGFPKNSNIIAVDWGKLSGTEMNLDMALVQNLESLPLYNAVVPNVPVVGRRLAEFLVFLQKNGELSGPDRVHLIGHSLGAHVSGMAGMYYNQTTGTALGRITGKDANL